MAHIDPAPFVSLTPKDRVKITEEAAQEAYLSLNRLSADPGSSCVCNHELTEDYDVQIIIPAYQVEKTIRRCLDSCFTERGKLKCLVTVVNDGSTDGTADILREYRDVADLEIITQENRGFSGARNAALERIRGKYLFFLDSDDSISYPALVEMYETAEREGADVVLAHYYQTDTEGNIRCAVRVNSRNFRGYPWGKLFRATLFRDVCFPEHYLFEDSVIMQVIAPRMQAISECDAFVYYYAVNPAGISSTSRENIKSIDSLYIFLALHRDRERLGIPLTKEYFEYMCLSSHLTCQRLARFGDEVLRPVFILFSHFAESVFQGKYETDKRQLRTVAEYLKKGEYGRWKRYCLLARL